MGRAMIEVQDRVGHGAGPRLIEAQDSTGRGMMQGHARGAGQGSEKDEAASLVQLVMIGAAVGD
eukprot:1155605-Pelagomonas_calceolata.AAC.3